MGKPSAGLERTLSPARNSTMIDGRARPEPAFDFVQDHMQNLKKG